MLHNPDCKSKECQNHTKSFVNGVDVESLLSMVNTERFIDYHQCLSIGKALYTIYDGNDIGLELWINRIKQSIINTKQTSKITEGDEIVRCQELYKVFNNNPFTIRTIAYYAKTDSPEQFIEWKRIYEMGLKSPHTWYEFKNGQWHILN